VTNIDEYTLCPRCTCIRLRKILKRCYNAIYSCEDSTLLSDMKAESVDQGDAERYLSQKLENKQCRM
jgi:hypothetical protein